MKSKEIDSIVLIIFLILASFYAYFTKDLFIGKAIIVGIVFIVPPIVYLGLGFCS